MADYPISGDGGWDETHHPDADKSILPDHEDLRAPKGVRSDYLWDPNVSEWSGVGAGNPDYVPPGPLGPNPTAPTSKRIARVNKRFPRPSVANTVHMRPARRYSPRQMLVAAAIALLIAGMLTTALFLGQ